MLSTRSKPNDAEIAITGFKRANSKYTYPNFKGDQNALEILIALIGQNFQMDSVIYFYDAKLNNVKTLEEPQTTLFYQNYPEQESDFGFPIYYTVDSDYINAIKNQFTKAHFRITLKTKLQNAIHEAASEKAFKKPIPKPSPNQILSTDDFQLIEDDEFGEAY